MQEPDVEVEITLTGKVQRAGLRAYIKNRAEEFGVRGLARNLDNGSVEVVAQGERKALEKFLEKVKLGSPFSKIEETEVTWWDSVSDPLENFIIE